MPVAGTVTSTTQTTVAQDTQGFVIPMQGGVYLLPLASVINAANDGAAATAGVAVGEVYRNGSVLMLRMS